MRKIAAVWGTADTFIIAVGAGSAHPPLAVPTGVRSVSERTARLLASSSVFAGTRLFTRARSARAGAICVVVFLSTGAALRGDEISRFLRGDANVDGRVTLADVFAVLRYAHAGAALQCVKAADVNDDGKVQMYDALELLGSIFYRHGAPPPPFTKPGIDPTEDSLTCRQGLDVVALQPLAGQENDFLGDPDNEFEVDCDDDVKGPDLEFIHFQGTVLALPGETRVRAPIYFFSPSGGVEGVTVSLFAPPQFITLEHIEFSRDLLQQAGATRFWSHNYTGQQAAGFLSSALILSVDEEVITLPSLKHEVLAHIEFSVNPQAPIGTTVHVVFQDTPAERGLPPIRNEVSRKAAVQPRHLCGLRVEIVSGEDVFVRGDANRDRAVNVADAVVILRHLFAPAGFPASLLCPDAADVDDNGRILLTDAVDLVQFLFLRGPLPSSPFPGAGRDPTTTDSLSCAEGI